jgi:hypothetical protein
MGVECGATITTSQKNKSGRHKRIIFKKQFKNIRREDKDWNQLA